MEINYQQIKLNSDNSREQLTIALGNFSCFHLGHFELLKSVINVANSTNTIPSVLCFSSQVSNKNIMTLKDKKTFLKKIGISQLIEIEFNDSFKKTSYIDFMLFLKETLNVNNVIVGEDYRFGYNRLGSTSDLKEMFNVNIIELKTANGVKISTSDIIQKIENGEIRSANKLLGFNYSITGIVQKGRQNGRKINFPTINISLNEYIIPKSGVYAAYLDYNGSKYLGMAYVGTHRTIDTLATPILELNVFNFNENLYEKTVTIELLERISDDFKFSNLNELQIALEKYKSTILKKYSAN